jgi:hypothetical protein
VFLSARLGVSGCRERIFGWFDYFGRHSTLQLTILPHAESGATSPFPGNFHFLVLVVVSTLVSGANTLFNIIVISCIVWGF